MNASWSSLTHVPEGVPLCAGVLLSEMSGASSRRLLFSLADVDREKGPEGAWRLSGIGGGADPGESPAACAQREALEEIGVQVTLCGADRGWHMRPDGTVRRLAERTWRDGVLPALVREVRLPPNEPRRPGQSGDTLWVVLYHAQIPSDARPKVRPLDVPGLVWMPWSLLYTRAPRLISRSVVEEAGGEIVESPHLDGANPDLLFTSHEDSEFVWIHQVRSAV